MDVNDISFKIERIKASLAYVNEKQNGINIEVIQEGSRVTMRAAERTDAELFVAIFVPLYSLHNTKDLINKALKRKNLPHGLFKTQIEGNMSLQLLFDLVNKDKHGAPLTSTWSHVDPIITNPKRAMQLIFKEVGSADFVTFDPLTGNPKVNENITVCYMADICEGNGKIICTLDELINNSMSAIEQFISDNSLA